MKNPIRKCSSVGPSINSKRQQIRKHRQKDKRIHLKRLKYMKKRQNDCKKVGKWKNC